MAHFGRKTAYFLAETALGRPTPIIESRALDETEAALREFVQVALNIGLARSQVQLMLRTVANDIEPKIIMPQAQGVQ